MNEQDLPDLHSCRAYRLSGNVVECLVDKPTACAYAMPWGHCFLCGHPDRERVTLEMGWLRKQRASVTTRVEDKQ